MKFKKLILILILFFVLFTNYAFAFEINTDSSLVSVPNAILGETSTNTILYEKSAYEKIYPASLTKILTALIVLEHCSIYEVITVNYDDIKDIPNGYSVFGLKADEEFTIEQLLHILLMMSASDAANVLATHVAGSIESFASLMNTKAIELGCQNSNFINPDGQHNEEHVSCAYDIYLIANEAIKNTTFTSIVKKMSYIIYPTNICSNERTINNTNQLLNSSSEYYYSRSTGVKTGFTTPAGNCLVATASENNSDFLLVVLGGGNNSSQRSSQRYLSAIELFDYGFENFGYSTIKHKDDYLETTNIINAPKNNNKLILNLGQDITAFVDLNKSYEDIDYTLNLKLTLIAPIAINDVVGTVSFNIEGQEVIVDVIAGNSVEVSTINSLLIIMILFSITCILAIIVFIVIKQYKKP